MKNILVTGGTGFLGQHLVDSLDSKTTDITVLLHKNNPIKDPIDSAVNYLFVDDLKGLTNSFDCILHLATSYGRTGETKEEVFDTNLKFGIEILEMATRTQSRCFINFDTNLPDNTNDYSTSKASFRDVVKKYSSDTLKIINLRLESIYGPNKKGTDFSNAVIQSCLNNTCYLELSECQQIRDFIYYKDVINCVKFIMDNLDKFSKYTSLQVGTGKGVSLQNFAELFKELSEASTEFKFGKVPYKDNEVMLSVANIESLNRMGWFPKTTLEEGFKEIILETSYGRSN